MTMHAFDTTVNRIPGTEVTVTVPIYSTEPGTVTASAPGCTFPDGNTKVIVGTRTRGNMGNGGQYLARAGAEGNGRSDCTFFIKVDWTQIQSSMMAESQYSTGALISSLRTDVARRANWMLTFQKYNIGTTAIGYTQSANSTTVEASIFATADASTADTVRKYAVVLASGASGDVGVTFYRAARANANTANRAVTTGTMGGTEALVWQSGVQCSKVAHKASNDELDAWFASETIPATDRVFVFAGGHEIDTASLVIWDTSGNVTPLDLTAAQVTGWQAPSMAADFVDSVTVVPASSIRVTIPAGVASPVTLTLTRPRQGVPSRATDGEKYETASGAITLVDTPAVVFCGPSQNVRSRL